MMCEKVTVMEKVRRERGMTKTDVARKAKIQQGLLGWIESGRFTPYDSQLEKIAAALEWDGDPRELLKGADENV
ncbi:MAG: helix-turn-helix domain-containing protein [Coriobacteriia bacterium]|nr:helix-turn-helix domain-containing protein [Coriobacteriia bacterium]